MGKKCAGVPSKEFVDKYGKLWENWLEGCPLREENNGFLLSTFKTVHLICILRKKSYFLHASLPNLVFNNKISLSSEKK